MPTYKAYFRSDNEWARCDFEAETPERAPADAREFYAQHPFELNFDLYESSGMIDEIEICNSCGDSVGLWQSQDLLLREAAADLLAAAEEVISRWDTGDLAEAARELSAAVSKAKGGLS